MRGATTTRARATAVAALVLAIAVVAIVVLGGGGGYELRAQFSNASQLVTGAQVHVAGRPVGTVNEIRLTENGLAEVVMEISDEDAPPMRRGARAQIRTGGLAGVANRFVVLRPGPPGAPEIPDGGVIGLDRTRAMVDLDAVLNGLDPATRKDLQGLLRFGERAFAGTGRQANEAFRYLNPALAQTSQLTAELVRDEAALRRLVRHRGHGLGRAGEPRHGRRAGRDEHRGHAARGGVASARRWAARWRAPPRCCARPAAGWGG